MNTTCLRSTFGERAYTPSGGNERRERFAPLAAEAAGGVGLPLALAQGARDHR